MRDRRAPDLHYRRREPTPSRRGHTNKVP